MDKPTKFLLPPPCFDKRPIDANKAKPHFLTPSGMTLLPREKQPPPMYGKRGATVPAKYLVKDLANAEQKPELCKKYCEPCEVELQSFEDYKRHRAQHEKCPVDGCPYRGHPTVMDKHVSDLHSSGLFEKFKKLNSPEEIAAWREERRKRFPTVANVLLKQKAREQRQQRGERLEATRNRFGNAEDRKRAQPNTMITNTNLDDERNASKSNLKSRKNKNKSKNNHKSKQNAKGEKSAKDTNKDSKKPLPEANVEEVPWHGLLPFRGTGQMKDYTHLCDKSKALSQNALFDLVGMYGSDDNSEEEDATENEDTKVCLKASDAGISQKQDVLMDDLFAKIVDNKEVTNLEGEYDDKPLIADKEKSNASNFLTETHIFADEINENKVSGTPTELSSKSFSNASNCNPQPLLVAACNSSDEGPEESPIQRSISPYQHNQEGTKTGNIMPLSNCVQESAKSLTSKQKLHDTNKPKQIQKRKSGLDYRKLKLRKQNTLLEKLLESDIRHERNVLLQCVRYVCENNFFGVGSKSGSSTLP